MILLCALCVCNSLKAIARYTVVSTGRGHLTLVVPDTVVSRSIPDASNKRLAGMTLLDEYEVIEPLEMTVSPGGWFGSP